MTKYTDPISFYTLFEREFQVDENTTSKIERVVIPQIQRDYAQGRKNASVTKIRSSFLSVLYNALCCNKSAKLDFIYGDISNGEMTPLDGQQRLTTLFLLHWYIAKHEGKDDIECLSKFSYQTRFSSRDFCLNLIEYQPDFNKDNLSLDIKDQSWFVSSWSNDPTIDSMLVMIDAIHAQFKDSGNLWEKLTAQDAPISFYFLPIKDMGLTDSLYIKMNSRGKALTRFEHFKAHFEKVIESVDKELYKEFTHKIDNDWTDLLWIYRGGNNIIDDEFLRYYRFVTEVISYTKGYDIVDDDFVLSESVYGVGNADARDNLTYLFRALDCWIGFDIAAFFSSLFSDKKYEDGKVKIYSSNSNLFLQCCNEYGEREGRRRRFTLNSTLLLYATLVYRLNCNSIDLTDLKARIRIVRNLVFNSSDEIREERMKDQLNETKDIILHSYINCEKGGNGYNQSQKEEENIKIEFRKAHPHLIKTLNHLEDHYLLQGTARIIMSDENNFDAANLSILSDNFFAIFNNNAPYSSIKKALLSIGDYSQLNRWRSVFGNNNHSSWRELFSYSSHRHNYKNTQQVVQKLLSNYGEITEAALNIIADKYISECETKQRFDWRYYLIKYDGMRQGASGVYYWEHRAQDKYGEFIMMNTPSSLSGRHWQPFLYEIYLDEELRNQITLEEYGNPIIINQTGTEIRCLKSCWEFKYTNGDIMNINIPQQDDVDTEDRILILKVELRKLLDNYITSC